MYEEEFAQIGGLTAIRGYVFDVAPILIGRAAPIAAVAPGGTAALPSEAGGGE